MISLFFRQTGGYITVSLFVAYVNFIVTKEFEKDRQIDCTDIPIGPWNYRKEGLSK
jgi:hypothetical protein